MSLSQEIESKINIVDLVSRYVPLKKSGMNYKWLSPFVQEKTPSFVVSPAKNIAYCFSSHRGGGPIRFLMEMEQIEYREAVQILAKEAGVELSTSFSREKWEKTEDIYLLHSKCAEWYHRCLFLAENRQALDYLLDRQITRETIDRFQLGYAGDSRDLYFAMREAGFSEKFLLESGIFLSTSRDKFFGRIIFPIANTLGHVVGFTARVLGDGMPKYLNSPATPIFDKSSILYGLHLAKSTVAKTGEILIVEGQMDTIALHQAGVDIAVGISGTALTTDHIRILRRFTHRIYLALDSDKAGVKATLSSIESIANENIDLKIISIPNGKDPDEYIKSGGDIRSLFASAVAPLSFLLREWASRYDLSSILGKRQLIQECLTHLTRLDSHSEIDLSLREIASTLGVSLDSLMADFQVIRRAKKQKSNSYQSEEKPREGSPLEYSIFDMMAVYLERFDFFDLFFENFRYTLEAIPSDGDFRLLQSVVAHTTLSLDLAEKKALVELIVETEIEQMEVEQIRWKFLSMIHELTKACFVQEKNKLIVTTDQIGSSVWLWLLNKAVWLGLTQTIMNAQIYSSPTPDKI